MKTKPYNELRRGLRILSGLMIVFFLIMFIGETFFGENPGKPLTSDAILQISVLGVGLIGLGFAWKWELSGGIIALLSFIVLAIINPDVLESIVIFWPITAIGYIVLWALSRNSAVRNQ
jgi:hypothetical protein